MNVTDIAYVFWGIGFLVFCIVVVTLLNLAFKWAAKAIDEEDQDSCPECNDNNLIRFSSLDKSVCSQCGTEIPWLLKPGQPPIVSSSRDRRRYRKEAVNES